MPALAPCLAGLTWAIRLSRIRGLWRWPLRNGEDWFLAQRVGPGFYREAGAGLLRSYRSALFIPLALDAPLALWLAVTARHSLLLGEQWIALIATVVLYNVFLAHFSARAATLVRPADEPEPPTTVQLSMAPRRLRDHSNRWVELAVASCLAVAVALVAHDQALAKATPENWYATRTAHKGMVITAWVLYLQLGLLLLKSVFVGWRMPLPMRRTEDFRRWRAAWLSYYLKLFDSLRLLFALMGLSTLTLMNLGETEARAGTMIAVVGWVLVMLAFTRVRRREARRLAAIEREIKPVELLAEFPRRPIPEGRFLAGGLLYFHRDNPHVLVRSAQGIALNLARPSAYTWIGYFVGLALLMTWMLR